MAASEKKTSEGPASRLGAEMRAAREKLGFELPDLAASLRIRLSYLEAIEAGNLSDLPGTTYALGFVRTYAASLGMPGEEIARRFTAEAEAVHARPKLTFPAPVPQGGVPAGAVMILGVVILGVAYGGWYWVSEHHATPVHTVPPIPSRLQDVHAQPAPVAPSPQVASILPSTAPPAPKAQVVAPPAVALAVPPAAPAPRAQSGTPAVSAPTPQTDGGNTQGTSPPPPLSPDTPRGLEPPPPANLLSVKMGTQPPPPPNLSGAAPVPTAPAVGEVVPAGSRVTVKFSSDVWFSVRLKGQAPIVNKLMHAGDSYAVPPDAGLVMSTGNAGGTNLEVDGKDLGVMGGSGGVRREVKLDADYLTTGAWRPKPKAAAAPAAPADPPVTAPSTSDQGAN